MLRTMNTGPDPTMAANFSAKANTATTTNANSHRQKATTTNGDGGLGNIG